MTNTDKKTLIKETAKLIIEHSLKVQPDDRVLIRFKSEATLPLLKTLIQEIFKHGGIPFVKLVNPELEDLLTANYSEKNVEDVLKRRVFDVENHDCFISLGYNQTFKKEKPISTFRADYAQATREINTIFDKKRWVLINYPSPLDAQRLGMDYDECFDYLLNCLCVDYQEMHNNMLPLKELMDKTKKVHIKTPDTDLTFSIEGIPSTILAGEKNLPDGEIFFSC